MKQLKYSLMAILLLTLTACAQAGAKEVAQGNQAFQQQDYAKALDSYQAAQKAAPDIAEPIYNAANVQYQQGAYDLAQARAEQALKKATGPTAENTHFNMGNSYFKLQKYDEAVEEYKEVLWQNPHAEDAKHNLELAQKMLAEQQKQQQEQQNKDSKDNKDNKEQKDNKDQQNKDSQDQQKKDQQGSDQQKSDKDKPKDDKSSQSEQEKQAEQDKEKQPQAGQSGEDKKPPDDKSQQSSQVQTVRLTAEQARQLLESAARNAQSLQQYLQQQPTDSPADQPKEDW